MKIVILDGHCVNPGDLSWDCLNRFGNCTVYAETDSEEEAIRRIGDSEIILTNKTPINARILDACPRIRYVGVLATGYNVVDCDACRERGIPVTNIPSYGTAAVAQFTIALLLEICHQIGYHDRIVHDGAWVRSSVFSFWETPQTELAGKTMGIIGFGKIGQAVGKLAAAFGMRVIAYSRTETDTGRQIAEYVTAEQLFRQSDVVSLHCPLFPETDKIINAESIGMMKDGAILLNTSRGGLLDEKAVTAALESGKLRAAAVDVVSQEPMKADNPLLHAPNCIITPHMAWAPAESRQRLLDCAAANLQSFLDGMVQNCVNR